MTFAHTTSLLWSLSGCPTPPAWSIDWNVVLAQYPWLLDLADTPQNPHYHAEGDVLTHTRMVAAALVALPAWQALVPATRSVLFAAALLHDIAKPICTEIDSQGRISSPRHALKGERLAKLVRHHGLPLWFLDKPDLARALAAASQVGRLDHVALLAEADVRGRICADQRELLDRIH